MDKLIQQLPHDDARFTSEWSDTLDQLSQIDLPDESILVLNALTDYLLANPTDSVPCYEKHLLISNIISKLVCHKLSIETKDLIKVFIRILDSERFGQWYVYFLETIYQKFRIGEQLCSTPIQIDLIDSVLQCLQTKTFVFNLEEDIKNWNIFLTRTLLSASTNDNNILNKHNVVETMQTTFQQFYKHAIQQSRYSTIWFDISTLLHESSSDIFYDRLKWDIILSETDLADENLSPIYILHLIQSHNADSELIRTHSTKLTRIIEHLILVNNYDDANNLLHKFIIPNLDLINIEELLLSLIRLCSSVMTKKVFCSTILVNVILPLVRIELHKSLALICFNLSLCILKLKVCDAPGLVYHLLQRRDFYPWNTLADGLLNLVLICISYETITDKEESISDLNQLENLLELIHRKAQNYPHVMKCIHSTALDAVLRWSNIECHLHEHVYRMGRSLLNFVNVQLVNEDTCVTLVDIIRRKATCTDEKASDNNNFFFYSLVSSLADIIVQLKRLSHSAHLKLAACLLSLLDYPFYDEDHNMTFQHVALTSLLFKTVSRVTNTEEARAYEPFLDRMLQCAKTNDTSELFQLWAHCWIIMGTIAQSIAAVHIPQFIDYAINRRDTILAGLLVTLSVQYADLLCSHVDDIVNLSLMNNGEFLTHYAVVFMLIVKKSPESFTSKILDRIFSSLDTVPFSYELSIMLQALRSVANHAPHLFDKHREKLIALVDATQNSLIFECFRIYIIASILNSKDENRAHEYLSLLVNSLENKKCSDEIEKQTIHTCLLIGIIYKQLLVCRRDVFVKLNSALLIHYLDDNVSSEMDKWTIQQARIEIEQIERSLPKPKPQNISEEPDIKTLPSWISQVAKMLNVPRNNDWRLLAKTFGFSPSEIQHWATQTNPCMALLHEWFITHTIEEAIYSLSKVTNEIGRYDVEKLIQEELFKSEKIIPNSSHMNIKRLPRILLSFHSNEQMRVVKLNLHLERAGYSCQLHDDQSEADHGHCYIRGAKVIVCCINMDYERSDICSKLFHSTIAMKKPFILLKMMKSVESLQDNVESVLQHYPYIEFNDDSTIDSWPENRFMELLRYIRYYTAPDSDMTSGDYHYWFVPRLQNLIFLRPYINLRDNAFVLFSSTPLVVSHPQIIISYQWDCQRDALSLYQQLTQLGYRVWLDIFQMTGGDPLLEKFNTIICQSSCLLACITPKYMKCVTCQYEISLAHSLLKPIIPLLIEETQSWPPNEFLLKAFDEKPYIDFQQSSSCGRWNGKQFSLLLGQLQRVLPDMLTNRPRHLLEMQRPTSASHLLGHTNQRSKRTSSASFIPQSQTCSLM